MITKLSLAKSRRPALHSINPILLAGLLLAGCGLRPRVGALQTESQSVELAGGDSVHVEVSFGAGNLHISGGAEQLLEADFAYNVAELKPQVEFHDGQLVIQQPDAAGLPNLRNISNFRNEWDLRFNNETPMEMAVDVGAGSIDLRPAGLSLSRLVIDLGATEGTIDLSGNWESDLEVDIDSGAADITVLLPKEVGVRVEVEAGPTAIQTTGLTRDGDFYVNDAYGEAPVSLQISLVSGIGIVSFVVVEPD